MEVIDDFLDLKDFNRLQNLLMGDEICWLYLDEITSKETDKFQFVHTFYAQGAKTSSFLEVLKPILNLIHPLSLYRIKANLLTKTSNVIENAFHIDMPPLSEKKIKQWTTSIFYVNTNNGYTKFEDGTKVESVANRMVTFPSNTPHCGTSCTDKKIRIVINFNYWK